MKRLRLHPHQRGKGFLSIELMIIVGVIVILVVLGMTSFANGSSRFSQQFSSDVTTALSQHDSLQAAIIS